MEFEGIVIRRVPYKGDDVMISVLTKDKMRSFMAHGVLKVFSKNSSSVAMFTKSNFQIYKGMEGDFLRVGEVITSHAGINSTLDKLSLLDFVSEVTNALLDRKDSSYVYDYLDKMLNCFDTMFSPWTAVLIYFAHVLTAAGYGLDVDECIVCGGKENICSVSYPDGGFICKDCFDELENKKINPRKLKILRYIFKVDIANFDRVEFEKEECKEIIFELCHFLNWASQIEIKSLTLLEKL